MQRLLKSTALEHSPGGEIAIDIRDSDIDAAEEAVRNINDVSTSKSNSSKRTSDASMLQPLKNNLAAQKRDDRFRFQFRLPSTEHLLQSVEALYVVEEPLDAIAVAGPDAPASRTVHYRGILAVSEAYLTFYSTGQASQYQTVLPLYTIRRVERLGDKPHSLKIVNWHQATIQLDLQV
jgi:hypothetical protein